MGYGANAHIGILKEAYWGNVDVHKTDDTDNGVTAPAADSLETAETLANEIQDDYNAHRVDTDFHEAADTTNASAAAEATNEGSLVTLTNELKAKLNAHFILAGKHSINDNVNTISADNCTDTDSAIVLINLVRAAYVAHLTEESDPTDYIPFISEGLTKEIEQVMEPTIFARPDEPPQFEGVNTYAGDIVLEGRPTALGYFLQSAFGPADTTALGGGIYQHVFALRTTEHSSYSSLQPYALQIHRDLGAANAFRYVGCIADRLQLEFGTGQKILKATAGIIAKNVSTITKTTPTFVDEDPFLWHQAAISIGASANYNLQAFSVALANVCEGIQVMNGTKVIGKVKRNGFRTADVSLTFDVEDLTEYNRFKNQTETAFAVTLTSGDNILLLEMNLVRYTAVPVNVSGPGRMTIQVTAKAKYDSTTKLIKATLTNTKASY
jgi:hypothetical protein